MTGAFDDVTVSRNEGRGRAALGLNLDETRWHDSVSDGERCGVRVKRRAPLDLLGWQTSETSRVLLHDREESVIGERQRHLAPLEEPDFLAKLDGDTVGPGLEEEIIWFVSGTPGEDSEREALTAVVAISISRTR